MYLYSIKFENVLANGGFKKSIKLPSDIRFIQNIGLFISNPINSTVTLSKKNIFPAIIATVNLFTQNNSILDLRLMNNEFSLLRETFVSGLRGLEFERYFDLNKIFIPINKNNVKNTNSMIVFKETDELKVMRTDATYGADYTAWQPEIEMFIEYLR